MDDVYAYLVFQLESQTSADVLDYARSTSLFKVFDFWSEVMVKLVHKKYGTSTHSVRFL